MSLVRLFSPFSSPFGDEDKDFDLFAFPIKSITDLAEIEKDNNTKHAGRKHNNNSGFLRAPCFQSGLHFHEDDSNFSVSIDLPGVKQSDVSLKLEQEDNHHGKKITVIHLSGHRKVRSADGSSVSESKFTKRFPVGDHIEVDKLTANLVDGVLTLSAPKKAPPAPVSREIEISTTSG